jgi:peptidoglycan/xylan/chitin deacetylase (PgdA/CDA1 family)
MFSETPLSGNTLPANTLCLSFDDGPAQIQGTKRGPKTLDLALYLRDMGIRATFFVVGNMIEGCPDAVPRMAALGHTVGNHTFNHIDMVTRQDEKMLLLSEISDVDDLIRPYIPDRTVYFRAPWGLWSPEIARSLNTCLHNGLDHRGPVSWDIDARDWEFWLHGESAEKCAAAYLAEIGKITKGIVLMHDSTADLTESRNNNLTFETVKLLVPALLEKGFQFASLEEAIPFTPTSTY